MGGYFLRAKGGVIIGVGVIFLAVFYFFSPLWKEQKRGSLGIRKGVKVGLDKKFQMKVEPLSLKKRPRVFKHMPGPVAKGEKEKVVARNPAFLQLGHFRSGEEEQAAWQRFLFRKKREAEGVEREAEPVYSPNFEWVEEEEDWWLGSLDGELQEGKEVEERKEVEEGKEIEEEVEEEGKEVEEAAEPLLEEEID